MNSSAPIGSTDLYSVALHEIGHVLGLSSSWLEWTSQSSAGQFFGPAAVAAYNADNSTSLSTLEEVSASNHHWEDGVYESFIFHNASPNYTGTVGPGVLQDLLLEPTANFTGTLRRFELTNVDVAALVDIGWSVVPQIEAIPGDYNFDGAVDAADYVAWRKGVAAGDYPTWRANFGEPGGSGSAANLPPPSAVP